MGNAGSATGQEHHDDYVDLDPFDGIETLGYRVLGVQPNSPASKAGLVSFLDFLVGANGQLLLGSGQDLAEGEEYDDVDLPALLQANKDKEVEFLVWNIKSQTERLVNLTPADDWGGAGLLGVTIRLDDYAGAEERLVRVLDVQAQSPAAVAGLVPLNDYLLGTTTVSLDSTATLATLLQEHENHVMELYVYNCESDMVRVVALYPTRSWGGAGLLGAELGTGYLHRLPNTVRDTAGTSVQRKVRNISSLQHNVLMEEPHLEMEPGSDSEEYVAAPASAPARQMDEYHEQVSSEKEEVVAPTPPDQVAGGMDTKGSEPTKSPEPTKEESASEQPQHVHRETAGSKASESSPGEPSGLDLPVPPPPPPAAGSPRLQASPRHTSPPIPRAGSITRSVSNDEAQAVFAMAPPQGSSASVEEVEPEQAPQEQQPAPHPPVPPATPAYSGYLPPPPHMHIDTPPTTTS